MAFDARFFPLEHHTDGAKIMELAGRQPEPLPFNKGTVWSQPVDKAEAAEVAAERERRQPKVPLRLQDRLLTFAVNRGKGTVRTADGKGTKVVQLWDDEEGIWPTEQKLQDAMSADSSSKTTSVPHTSGA